MALKSGGKLSPHSTIRYRGYYYDSETGFYYVSSRYYNPEVGRFLNADRTDILKVQNDLYDKNLYAYCDNNPVIREDINGMYWIHVGVIGASSIIGGVLGAFSASQTGGNVVEGFVQGMLTGLVSASMGLFLDPIGGFILATMIGRIVDAGIQATSYRIRNGTYNSSVLNWNSIIDTGLQTGISTAVPYIGTGAKILKMQSQLS